MKNINHILLALLLISLVACDSDINFTYDSMDAAFTSESGTGGSMARFTIVGDNLYTVDGSYLKGFDISSENIELKSSKLLDWNGGIETIFPYNNKLFLGTTTGMHIIDISNPDQAEYISKYEHVISCDPVVVQGNYAYVTLHSGDSWCARDVNQLQVINISDLSHPKLVKTLPMSNPKGLGVDGDLLFVCDGGLKVYTLDSPTVPVYKTTFTNINNAYDVIPYNGLLLLISEDGLHQYHYNSEQLTLLSSIQIN